jgi:hypothetical protein
MALGSPESDERAGKCLACVSQNVVGKTFPPSLLLFQPALR